MSTATATTVQDIAVAIEHAWRAEQPEAPMSLDRRELIRTARQATGLQPVDSSRDSDDEVGALRDVDGRWCSADCSPTYWAYRVAEGFVAMGLITVSA